jgi:GrpB-like predicted nucleotidyltransferase (UPF0157 family)
VPVGIQLATAGSPEDRAFIGLRELMRARPDLVESLNGLKRSLDGGDAELYWRAKQDIIEGLIAERLPDRPPEGHS